MEKQVKRKVQRLPEVLTGKELNALIGRPPEVGSRQYARELRDYVLLAVMYDAGLRVSELCDLRLGQVPTEGGGWYRIIGKGRRERDVRLFPCHHEDLRAWIEQGRPRYADPGGDGWLFLSRRGNRMDRRTVEYMVSQRGEERLGRKVWPHVLRHTCATHLFEQGAPLRVVQKYMGHASIVTTQIYAHVSTRHMGEVLDRCHPSAQHGRNGDASQDA